MTLRFLATRASAFVPVVMSAAALLIVALALALGSARQADEGAAARIWQLLIAAQLPIVGYFAFKWLAIAGRQGLIILAIQVIALAAAVAPVFVLGL